MVPSNDDDDVVFENATVIVDAIASTMVKLAAFAPKVEASMTSNA